MSKMSRLALLVFALIFAVSGSAALAQYNEAPMLAEKVAAGELPPVADRLPAEPVVVDVLEEIGQYGGTWNRLWLGLSDSPGPSRITTERLLFWTPDGQGVEPNVLKDIEISDDVRVFTMHMREGMRWSDGEPFTSADIMFWWEDIILNEELTPAVPAWLNVGGQPPEVEALDEYTVRFTFAEPYGIFTQYLAGPQGHNAGITPKHYLSQFHPNYVDEAELEAMTAEEGYDFWFQLFEFQNEWWSHTERPTLSAWTTTAPGHEAYFVLTRNPYYWKVDAEGNQLPYVDEIVHALVEDIEVLNIRAINGYADMQARHLLPDKMPLFVQNAEQAGYRVVRYMDDFETNMAIGINLNNQDPVLREIVNDKRFRVAMSHAIDRDEMNQLAYMGMCEEPRQVVPLKDSPYYTEIAEEYAYSYIEYDPETANALLDEMGLTERTSDGRYRLRPDGEVLSLTIEFTPAFGPWEMATELLADYWSAVGVRARNNPMERTLFYERKLALQHDVGVWTGAAGMQTVLGPRWYMPENPESIHAIGYGLWYATGGREGEKPSGDLMKTIELYDELKQVATMEERVALFDEMLKLNMENLWVIGTLSAPPLIGVISNDFRNVPEEGVYSWIMHSPKNFYPEQFFFEQ